ncbi:MAG: DUF4445 domain-containing protein [Ruminococcaceae bacterium]|nr:DUF4445 domain-containing protein [Oscillospiraceae bacterium]
MKFMRKIKIDSEIILAEDGELLSDILIKNGKAHEHPCGGRGTCRKCTVFVDGKKELSCQYRIKSDIEVVIPEESEILSVTGAEESGKITENMCFVLDIGTTTLALALVSLDEKKIIKVITRTNPQRIFGADVMSRIDYCRKNSVSELQGILADEVNKMIENFGVSEIDRMYAAGNTTMLHIFFGVDPSSMGTAPYSPVFLESKREKTDKIKGVKEIISLPSFSAFVGADLVAGLNFAEMPSEEKYNLLIDLGTNAEILLFSEEKILCTSAAAGPCFEGANISCGMSAVDGAISAYRKGRIETIGNKPAKGICGTGLIDIVAELLSDGTIDETGFMECEEFEIAENVSLTQGDIRQYQLAKSAIYSAVLTLLKNENVTFENIEKVYLSGGFSAKINIQNAARTGLIPEEMKDKCVPINNSSLLGTAKYAIEQNDLTVFTEKAEYIDLSSDKYFSDLFIENMQF